MKKRKKTGPALKLTVIQTTTAPRSSDAPFETDTLYPAPASEHPDAVPVIEAISSDPPDQAMNDANHD